MGVYTYLQNKQRIFNCLIRKISVQIISCQDIATHFNSIVLSSIVSCNIILYIFKVDRVASVHTTFH